MYDFSGIHYKIWASDVYVVAICAVVMFLQKPWKHKFKLNRCIGMISLVIILIFTFLDASRIIWPQVSSYRGEFVSTNRAPREAPPLPFTHEYVFWNGEGKKQVYFLDGFSKDKIFPEDLEIGEEYTVYYDDYTNIIVGIEISSE